MVQTHFSSFTVGTFTGIASLAVPDGVTTWLGKLFTGILIALVTGLVHGWAKRWAAGKRAEK